MKFPRDITIVNFTGKQLDALAEMLNSQWDFQPDMTVDEQCFFIADHIIPNNLERISVSEFLESLTFLKERKIISPEQYSTLVQFSGHYCQEVLNHRSTSGTHISLEEENEDHSPLYFFFTLMLLLNSFSGPLLSLLGKSNQKTQDAKPFDLLGTIDNSLTLGLFLFTLPFFSLPTVNAETSPKKSRLGKLIPEYETGTDQHDSPDAIEQIMDAIHESLEPYFSNKPQQRKIILAGEQHAGSFWQELCLTIYLKIRKDCLQNTTDFKFIIESTVGDQVKNYIAGVKNSINNFHIGNYASRQLFLETLTHNCLAHADTNAQDARGFRLAFCPLLSIMLYEFEIDIANTEFPLTPKQQALIKPYLSFDRGMDIWDIGRKIPIPTHAQFPFHYRRIDEILMRLIRKHLEMPGNLVVFMGAFHLQYVSSELTRMGEPHVILNLVTNPRLEPSFQIQKHLAAGCIKPLKDCIQKVPGAVKQSVSYCLSDTPYKKENCDDNLHQKFIFQCERIQFFKNKTRVSQIPVSTLQDRQPENLGHFFAPKKVIKKLKDKFLPFPKGDASTSTNTLRTEL